MRKLLERIEAGEVLVADGACGTMLMERGLTPGQAPDMIWARVRGVNSGLRELE
jgi:methionine synthase I (cobalamin-dependent)